MRVGWGMTWDSWGRRAGEDLVSSLKSGGGGGDRRAHQSVGLLCGTSDRALPETPAGD